MSPSISSPSGLAETLRGWPPPVLDPRGPYSEPVTTLAWALFIGLGVVFLLVCVALVVALFGPPRWRARLAREGAVRWLGLYLPAVVLVGLTTWATVLYANLAPVRGDEMRVRVSANIYWWRVSYLDTQGREVHADANELHIPAGRPVMVELVSEDVIHSFWVPQLGGKMDAMPGRTNRLRLQADQPGQFGGQCAEFCGGAHALMGFVVVAHDEAGWTRWLASRLVPPPIPAAPGADAEIVRGRQLFEEVGCAACHRVAGTSAQGLAGPDLTHVGSRRSLGAGILPNTRAALIGWIGDSPSIKPSIRMPSYRSLDAGELNALASYLEALR